MPPPRKFDHDAARTLVEAGFYIESVAAMFGVSRYAVWRIASEKNRVNTSERAKARWQAACSGCGEPCVSETHPSKHAEGRRPPRAMCRRCAGLSRRQRFRFDELGQVAAVFCTTCKTFKEPEAFGRGVTFGDMRPGGFHKSCRTCLTKLRQDYRERHKVPCITCGAPCLLPSEKGPRRADTGLCKACYLRSVRKVPA